MNSMLIPLSFKKGATCMYLALRMSKQQLLLLALVIVTLLAISLFIIHTAVPSVWHTLADDPGVLNGWH
jgi:hypothetical protein